MFIDWSIASSCQINSLENYTDDLKNCEDTPLLSIVFNITKWSEIPQQLINETPMIHTIYVNNTSMQSIDDNGFCQ